MFRRFYLLFLLCIGSLTAIQAQADRLNLLADREYVLEMKEGWQRTVAELPEADFFPGHVVEENVGEGDRIGEEGVEGLLRNLGEGAVVRRKDGDVFGRGEGLDQSGLCHGGDESGELRPVGESFDNVVGRGGGCEAKRERSTGDSPKDFWDGILHR